MCRANCIDCTWADASILWAREHDLPSYRFEAQDDQTRLAWFDRARELRRGA